jgi:hypothetical protein
MNDLEDSGRFGKKLNPARTFSDLIVWRKAHEFVLWVYRFTMDFPQDERFGLTSQFRRAAISIPANVAEGFKKKDPSDKARFINISQGVTRRMSLLSHFGE